MFALVARRAVIGLVAAAGMTLLTAAPAAAEPVAAESLPSCLDHQWAGNAGVINVRTSPSRTIAWNVQDYTDNSGFWQAIVYVDDKKVDEKRQNYNPHGSVSPRHSRSGSIFRLDITHTDTQGRTSHNVPNGCVVP
ncbi:MAG: hypothetical protein ACT4RN_04230 [Pseudonocardia sp.]